jgi:hypothetical protein
MIEMIHGVISRGLLEATVKGQGLDIDSILTISVDVEEDLVTVNVTYRLSSSRPDVMFTLPLQEWDDILKRTFPGDKPEATREDDD